MAFICEVIMTIVFHCLPLSQRGLSISFLKFVPEYFSWANYRLIERHVRSSYLHVHGT